MLRLSAIMALFLWISPLNFVSAEVIELKYSTYLGGSNYSAGLDLAVDLQSRAWVVGFTSTTDFPVINPSQDKNANASDGFVVRLSPSEYTLEFSSYLGGSGNRDWIEAITLDENNQAYLTGSTNSNDFPTYNSYQTSRG